MSGDVKFYNDNDHDIGYIFNVFSFYLVSIRQETKAPDHQWR